VTDAMRRSHFRIRNGEAQSPGESGRATVSADRSISTANRPRPQNGGDASTGARESAGELVRSVRSPAASARSTIDAVPYCAR
jgi:hypothetical protein